MGRRGRGERSGVGVWVLVREDREGLQLRRRQIGGCGQIDTGDLRWGCGGAFNEIYQCCGGLDDTWSCIMWGGAE